MKRIVNPAGIWRPDQLVGACVKINSLPSSNFFAVDNEAGYTIGEVYFKVSTDGKAITMISLKELEGVIFTLRDIEIVSLPNGDSIAVSGQSLSGQTKSGVV